MGSNDLTAYLIATPQGNILLNASLASSVPQLRRNIEALGLRLANTKLLLIIQAHFDHVGGTAELQRLTGAQLANKWLLILLALMQRSKRDSELQRRIQGVSPKMLSQSLRQLEERGLVQREVYAQVPPRVEYSLTDLGQSLAPLLVELCDWSVQWAAREPTPLASSLPTPLVAQQGR